MKNKMDYVREIAEAVETKLIACGDIDICMKTYLYVKELIREQERREVSKEYLAAFLPYIE